MYWAEAEELLRKTCKPIFEPGETDEVIRRIGEHCTGLDRMALRLQKEVPVQDAEILRILAELEKQMPIQYILGTEWFGNLELKVNSRVLIPRPETEELVRWIAEDWVNMGRPASRILDIGTGSGCIPVWLKVNYPPLELYAVDISTDALLVAEANARKYQASVRFARMDILHPDLPGEEKFDLLVSNPPYITDGERSEMHARVLDFEPSLALFVTDGDPLQFYKAIIHFASVHLKAQGLIYLELGSKHAGEVRDFFHQQGFDVTLRKDMYGLNRMLKAKKKPAVP